MTSLLRVGVIAMLDNKIVEAVEIWAVINTDNGMVVDLATNYVNANQRAQIMNRVFKRNTLKAQKIGAIVDGKVTDNLIR